MVTEICEHAVDLDLLPQGAKILDLGCLGFLFSDEMIKLGNTVVSVDIQDLPSGLGRYFQCAITDHDGMCGIKHNPTDPQATTTKPGNEIMCYTLESFSERRGIKFWDCIKMDVEGEEYKIIMSLEKAPAKQLSVEFHLHTGVYGDLEMTMMEDKLKALGYEAVRHEKEARYCAGWNYWSSLFVLK